MHLSFRKRLLSSTLLFGLVPTVGGWSACASESSPASDEVAVATKCGGPAPDKATHCREDMAHALFRECAAVFEALMSTDLVVAQAPAESAPGAALTIEAPEVTSSPSCQKAVEALLESMPELYAAGGGASSTPVGHKSMVLFTKINGKSGVDVYYHTGASRPPAVQYTSEGDASLPLRCGISRTRSSC